MLLLILKTRFYILDMLFFVAVLPALFFQHFLHDSLRLLCFLEGVWDIAFRSIWARLEDEFVGYGLYRAKIPDCLAGGTQAQCLQSLADNLAGQVFCGIIDRINV